MKPLVLIILDGWGTRLETSDNGIALAKKPHFDSFLQQYPHTLIDASGKAVGLPQGIMGNSEVGHMNMGAGRIVFSGLSQIYQAIEDKSFFTNPAFLEAMQQVKKRGSRLHLMGLLSDGAVHSHQDHLYALLDLAKNQQVNDVFVHAFMDGRDTSPREGLAYLKQLQKQLDSKKIGKIASISGRYYAMDRDKRWERVEQAYDVLVGVTRSGSLNPEDIIRASYHQDIGDEFIVPQNILDEQGHPVGAIQDGDAVIFFNFRPDRAREITRALTDPSFDDFERKIFPKISCFVCMGSYDSTFNLPIAFLSQNPKRVFAEIVSEAGLSQLRIAETEKYAHVTYFFSGGQENVFPGEDRILVASPREVPTYDHKPEMSATKITEQVLPLITQNKYDVIIMNFANADMVGHTAKKEAIIRAIETVDNCLGQIVSAVLQKKGAVVITADHGNAEQMVDEAGHPHTAHTTNLVPFILISDQYKSVSLQPEGGRLCDVAPTLLHLLRLKQPAEMTGHNLISSS